MVMVCFSEIIGRKQRYRASPNALRIRVARVRINHLGP